MGRLAESLGEGLLGRDVLSGTLVQEKPLLLPKFTPPAEVTLLTGESWDSPDHRRNGRAEAGEVTGSFNQSRCHRFTLLSLLLTVCPYSATSWQILPPKTRL